MKLSDHQEIVLDALQRGVVDFADLPGGRGRVLFVVRELAALGLCASSGDLTPLGESLAPVDGYPGHWHELPPQDVAPRLLQLRQPAEALDESPEEAEESLPSPDEPEEHALGLEEQLLELDLAEADDIDQGEGEETD